MHYVGTLLDGSEFDSSRSRPSAEKSEVGGSEAAAGDQISKARERFFPRVRSPFFSWGSLCFPTNQANKNAGVLIPAQVYGTSMGMTPLSQQVSTNRKLADIQEAKFTKGIQSY